MDCSDLWHELAKTALKHLDLDIGITNNTCYLISQFVYITSFAAIRAYQRIEDIAMVLSLQQIQVRVIPQKCNMEHSCITFIRQLKIVIYWWEALQWCWNHISKLKSCFWLLLCPLQLSMYVLCL